VQALKLFKQRSHFEGELKMIKRVSEELYDSVTLPMISSDASSLMIRMKSAECTLEEYDAHLRRR
jgi:hypothetical protein